jgi:hypothetical protein
MNGCGVGVCEPWEYHGATAVLHGASRRVPKLRENGFGCSRYWISGKVIFHRLRGCRQ